MDQKSCTTIVSPDPRKSLSSRESHPGVIPDYPGLSRIKTFDRRHTIPGVGLLTATALVACVGDVRRFPSGRYFASYLGLTPKEHSSGSRRRLGAISKQGDRYLRTLLIHGARSVLWRAKSQPTPDAFRTWALALERRRGHNKAAVAVANKLARMIWRIWQSDRPFCASPGAA